MHKGFYTIFPIMYRNEQKAIKNLTLKKKILCRKSLDWLSAISA